MVVAWWPELGCDGGGRRTSFCRVFGGESLEGNVGGRCVTGGYYVLSHCETWPCDSLIGVPSEGIMLKLSGNNWVHPWFLVVHP